MKEIVKVLIQEGVDEETIHEVLNVIEENYEVTNEGLIKGIKNYFERRAKEKKVAKQAQRSDIGRIYNKNSHIANGAVKEVKRVAKEARKATGAKRQKLVAYGKRVQERGRQAGQTALDIQSHIANYASQRGANPEQTKKFVKVFSRPGNELKLR